jgi:hypothetical protein
MTRTGVTEREKSKKGSGLKTCRKSGSARFAVPVPSHLSPWARANKFKRKGKTHEVDAVFDAGNVHKF